MKRYKVSIPTSYFHAEDARHAVEQYADELGCFGDIPEWLTPNVVVEDITYGSWVYDGSEDRCWGPFEDEDDANRFIESDKYLASWCVVLGEPRGTKYPPAEFHGSWPEEGDR